MSRPQTAPASQRGHAGDWLRRYKDLPPDEQERALQSDPAFQKLPPARQELLRQRLQHFSSLPPQQQLQMLNRMTDQLLLVRQTKPPGRRSAGNDESLRMHLLMPQVQNKRSVAEIRAGQVRHDLRGRLSRDATR